MELFPAANEEQWEWIKKVIDNSDYYIVILGGRYGSISEKTGLSYTEMEYRYAVEAGKPVIGFIHENPNNILRGKSENNPISAEKLESFRDLVSSRLCKFWSSPSDLGAKVSRSITQLIKHNPAVGWIKANTLNESTSKELLDLRKKNEELLEKLSKARTEKPSGIDELSQGKDLFDIEFNYELKIPAIGANKQVYWKKGEVKSDILKLSWNTIFSYIGPNFITPEMENWVNTSISELIAKYVKKDLDKRFPENRVSDITITRNSFNTIKIQFRALNLITHASIDRHWTLTPYGETHLTNILAVRRA